MRNIEIHVDSDRVRLLLQRTTVRGPRAVLLRRAQPLNPHDDAEQTDGPEADACRAFLFCEGVDA